MRAWKKLASLALALAVVMSLTVSAWAADGVLGNTAGAKAGIGNNVPTKIDGTSFTVDLSNAEAAAGLPRPQQVYSYTISGNGVTFKSDQTSPAAYNADTQTATVTFPAVPNGVAAGQATVGLDFNSTDASVTTANATQGLKYYSVNITQTAPGGETTEYTLYVYVNGDNNDPYAAVMVPSATTWAADMSTSKVSGFTNVFTASVQDVTLKKELDGSMADTNLDFPFTVKITLPTAYNIEGTEISASTANNPSSGTTFANYTLTAADVTAASVEMSGQLKGGESVVFANLPVGTVVEVKETTSSALGYSITSAITGTNTKTELTTAVNTETSYATRATVETGNDVTITYTNSLDAISPTGVVLRFAPYLAMLGAGVTTMVIAPRRKEEE